MTTIYAPERGNPNAGKIIIDGDVCTVAEALGLRDQLTEVAKFATKQGTQINAVQRSDMVGLVLRRRAAWLGTFSNLVIALFRDVLDDGPADAIFEVEDEVDGSVSFYEGWVTVVGVDALVRFEDGRTIKLDDIVAVCLTD